MTKPKILVVEDDSHTAKAICLQLQAAGFNAIEVATTGKEAIVLAEHEHPALVLMDIVLEGGMDGIETAEIIRERLQIPVLYLTSSEDREKFERAKATGPFGYLVKPVTERDLALTIEIALYRHQLETRLRESERHLADAQRLGRLGSWDWNIRCDCFYGSEELFRMFGQPVQREGFKLDTLIERVPSADRPVIRKAIKAAFENGHRYSIYHRIRLPNEQERIVHHSCDVELDDRGEVRQLTGTVQDVTQLKAAEAKLWHIAHHDPLCDLPNRMLMYDRLSQTLARAQRNKKQVALMMFDLDDFKKINDTYGHQVGDNLLIEVANRLRHCVRDSDTIARLGGDEFTIIIDQLAESRDVAVVAKKIVEAMQEPISLDGQIVQVTCSIGIALYPADASNMDELLKTADNAMYDSKRTGKNTFHFHADVKRHTH